MARVRLQDVADRAGVSMKTVSNVVRDKPYVSETMRAKVQHAIDELGYRPHLVGRRLATGRTGFIALALPRLAMPYFARLATLVSDEARAAGYRVLIIETDAMPESERSVVFELEQGLADGVLFHRSRMSLDELARHRRDLPLVMLGEAEAPPTLDHVRLDNVAAARLATDHLIAAGRRRIGFVGHELGELSETSQLRIAGYRAALEHAGIPFDPDLLLSTDLGAEGAVRTITDALDRGLVIDGLACRDDLAALGALRAVQLQGLRVPQDVMITGWDNIFITEVTYPSITTIEPDLDTLVRTALGYLIERIDGYSGPGRHEYTPHRLIVRESAPAVDSAP